MFLNVQIKQRMEASKRVTVDQLVVGEWYQQPHYKTDQIFEFVRLDKLGDPLFKLIKGDDDWGINDDGLAEFFKGYHPNISIDKSTITL